ncbi:hypothetical protein ADT26_05205 [Xanthomonas oryzae]|nr:hypothetical protein AXO1947_11290 [Xanthomonas oryzae pv. oryzae]KOR46767.1 hypothetical protein ADT26_05205 [Xanthomonas oryzae]AUI90449.1 hypothetical protein BVV16_10115 [Xanthomonas oryzae pv. oryzae]AUI94124.1 hypothetical protein BVV17_10125 [Xanthomonas oryzae pv. oryzae]AUI97794.1 hypothetical protein BVV18_10130 [Xanthomonas oryzae pv. oryzae]
MRAAPGQLRDRPIRRPCSEHGQACVALLWSAIGSAPRFGNEAMHSLVIATLSLGAMLAWQGHYGPAIARLGALTCSPVALLRTLHEPAQASSGPRLLPVSSLRCSHGRIPTH